MTETTDLAALVERAKVFLGEATVEQLAELVGSLRVALEREHAEHISDVALMKGTIERWIAKSDKHEKDWAALTDHLRVVGQQCDVAQQRAEAAEREASRAYDEGAETAIAISNRIVRESGLERIAMQQDRDTARAENAALREALGEARESGFHGFACKLEQREPPCGGWSDEQIAEDCTCWVGRAAALTPEPLQRPQERADSPEAGGGV